MKPLLGRGTAATRVRLRNGLTCDVEEGDWKLTVDMGPKSGGEGHGPNPGVLGRGALGSCLAISYAMWAAHLEVPIEELSVVVEADYDSGAALGVSDVAPGYRAVRYLVQVKSPAPEAEVLSMLEQGEQHCAYLDVFRRAQHVKREARITKT